MVIIIIIILIIIIIIIIVTMAWKFWIPFPVRTACCSPLHHTVIGAGFNQPLIQSAQGLKRNVTVLSSLPYLVPRCGM
jgi:hypothetical protein